MLAAISAPIAAAALGRHALFPILLGFTLLVLWRHHENIVRLRAGTEPRIGKKRG
jgi:glycerol-3-phosphate acyltransferase PlsY